MVIYQHAVNACSQITVVLIYSHNNACAHYVLAFSLSDVRSHRADIEQCWLWWCHNWMFYALELLFIFHLSLVVTVRSLLALYTVCSFVYLVLVKLMSNICWVSPAPNVPLVLQTFHISRHISNGYISRHKPMNDFNANLIICASRYRVNVKMWIDAYSQVPSDTSAAI